MKRTIYILLTATLHWLVTIGLEMLKFTYAGFLGLFPEPGHDIVAGLLSVLQFPFWFLHQRMMPEQEQLLLPATILNSLVWGVVLYLLISLFVVRKKARI